MIIRGLSGFCPHNYGSRFFERSEEQGKADKTGKLAPKVFANANRVPIT